MENFTAIDFHRTRDFGRKVNATFEFIRQNFKPLLKSILFIVGPPVLVAALLLGSFMNGLFLRSMRGANNPESVEYFTSAGFWLQMVLMFVFMMVAGIMTIATINNYIVLYGEKRSNNIEVHEVWARVRQTFWMHFFSVLFFAVLFIIAYVVFLIPMVLITPSSPFLFFVGFTIFLVLLCYFFFSTSLVFFVQLYEQRGFFAALGRSFRLVQNKWWSTFGIIMIMYFIAGFISYLPLIPMYVALVVSAIHSVEAGSVQQMSTFMQVFITSCFVVYYLFYIVLQSLPNVAIAFQYFNLVELKEARGLLSDIDTLGQQPSLPASDEHY